MKFLALLYILCVFGSSVEAKESMLTLTNNGKYWPDSTRFLVIVHQYDGDVRWAKRLNFPHVIYEKEKPEKEPFNARNKAKAETNLLKFIAEFYDDLPENIIQVYQYEYKPHHEGSLVDILNSPNFEKKYAQSKTRGFWNFNKLNMGAVAAQIPRMLESGWWSMTMAPWFGDIQGYGNFTQGKRLGAQFVVSRDRIKTLPREFYVNMYEWLVNNTIGEMNVGFDPSSNSRRSTPLDDHSNSNFYTSRYMEWSWELIFTSHKPHEDSAVPFVLPATSQHRKHKGRLSALYGAKKYYRDVSHLFMLHFFRNDKFVIPVDIDFSKIFTDVVCHSLKNLILNIDGKEYIIPEKRKGDITINWTWTSPDGNPISSLSVLLKQQQRPKSDHSRSNLTYNST